MQEFFTTVAGLGFILCVVTGMQCAAGPGPKPGPSFRDGLNLRGRWRGALKIGGAMIAIGMVGQLILLVVA